jgi:hypothetical protein
VIECKVRGVENSATLHIVTIELSSMIRQGPVTPAYIILNDFANNPSIKQQLTQNYCSKLARRNPLIETDQTI